MEQKNHSDSFRLSISFCSLFALPDFGSFPLDVSATLNRMRYACQSSQRALNFSSLVNQPQDAQPTRTNVRSKDDADTSHLYICTFFNQQTDHDILESLKSVLRMDEEQCARRNALKFLIEIDPDYFEFESKTKNIIRKQFTQLATANFKQRFFEVSENSYCSTKVEDTNSLAYL